MFNFLKSKRETNYTPAIDLNDLECEDISVNPPKQVPLEWNDIKQSKEYQDLIDAYNNCNKQYYDFTIPFKDKLKQGKHLTTSELITLTGLAPEIKDIDLKLRLYQTLLEELVLIVTSE